MHTETRAASRDGVARRPVKVSVVIPTYRRPELLHSCVASILGGSKKPAEIVIVGREGDQQTRDAVAKIIQDASGGSVAIRSAWVSVPGHIPPVETGARTAAHELVAILDDDVTVTPDWLSAMLSHFSDAAIGVVGGRVLVPGNPVPEVRGKPGRISWYGKHWGNLGSMSGLASVEVDSAMEGNCMWRREVLTTLEFDPTLNFDDASMYGLDLCLQAKKRALRVVYEPSALVYHHKGPRAPELERSNRAPRVFSYCRNYTYIALKRFPPGRKLSFLAWWFLIGERNAWGLGALAFDLLSGGQRKDRHVMNAWRGKIEGLRLWLK